MKPDSLPHPAVLRRRHQALAAVERLVAPNANRGDRYYGSDPPHRYWHDSGGGDNFELVIDGKDALLTAFNHESPRSPWGRDDGNAVWPGMFDGLPERLRPWLPEHGDEPMSVSACFWFTDGRWHEGEPEAVASDGDVFDDDPGGVTDVLRPLLDTEAEVRELVGFVHEQPDRVDEALALVREMKID